MKSAIQRVREFQEKHGFAVGRNIRDFTAQPHTDWLAHAGSILLHLSKQSEGINDLRVSRAHLMLEELGELLIEMSRTDEQGVLDGLADLLYVVLGMSVSFDLPLDEAFDEVHRSNMTKERQSSDPTDRLRHKGPNYQPPNLRDILLRKGRSVSELISHSTPTYSTI